jgi:excisionase family DNA binding protein
MLGNEEQEEMEREYSVGETAEILNRARGTVYDWCRLERVHSIRRGGKRLIPAAEIERLKSSNFELLEPNLLKVPPSLRSRFPQS